MFFRRAREDRAFREAQRAGYELLLQLQATQPWPDAPEPTATAPAAEEAVAVDFLPPELRVPSRREVAGLMMRCQQPLVIGGEVRTCPGRGAYRDWIAETAVTLNRPGGTGPAIPSSRRFPAGA